VPIVPVRRYSLGGWSGGGSTSNDYGSGFTPERLYGAIKAVRYDGLDLSHLYLTLGRQAIISRVTVDLHGVLGRGRSVPLV